MASSLSQIRVLCSILTVSSFSLEIERIYRPQKSLGFYSSGWRNSGWLPGFSFAQINPGRSNHFFGLFFSLLVEFHRDWGIEWRGILCPTHPVLLQPPTTHFACILRRFWHTHLHVRIYSSQKQNIVIPEMMAEANLSYSALFLSPEHGKGQFYKLWKFIQD